MLLTNIIIYFIWLRFHCITLRRQIWSPPYTTASIQSVDKQTRKHTWTECKRMLTESPNKPLYQMQHISFERQRPANTMKQSGREMLSSK